MEARPLPAFISKKPKSIHPPTRQPLDLHSQTHSGGPRLDEVRVAEKRGCKHAAVLLWSASQVQIRERAEKTQTLLPSAFGCLGGWSCAPRCNLCSQAGTRQQQEQRPACAGQGPRLRRLLPSPPGTVSSTNPQLSCIVIRLPAGIGVLCITEAGRTVGLLSQRMGWDCLFVPGHASLLSYNKDNTRLSRAHLSRAKKPHYCLRWTGQPNRGSG